MVEINNQRKAFDMLAWSEGTDNGTSETRKSWLWRHCGVFESYLLITPITLANLSRWNQNSNQQAPDATSFSRWWDAYRKQSYLKDFSRKVRTLWHCSRLRSVALYLWLIVVISVRQSTVAAISGLHCRALVMVSSSIRLTAWLQNSKKRAERSERLMYEQSHRDYLRSGYLHHRLPVMGWLIITVITPLPTKPSDKNARELKLANAAITDMQMRQRDVTSARCKIHEGVSWC